MDRTSRIPSPAFVVAMIALFVSLVGTAVGGDDNPFGIPKNSIGPRELENNAVGTKELDNGSVGSKDLGSESVGSDEIQSEAVDSAELRDEAVQTEHLTHGAVPPLALKVLPRVQAHNSTAQTIPNGSHSSFGTDVVLDSEYYDYEDEPMHDNAANNTRLVAPIDGVYRIHGSVEWDENATGWRRLTIWHGKTIPGPIPLETEALVATRISDPTLGVPQSQGVVKTMRLSAGEWVVLRATQSSGGPLNIGGGGEDAASFGLDWSSP